MIRCRRRDSNPRIHDSARAETLAYPSGLEAPPGPPSYATTLGTGRVGRLGASESPMPLDLTPRLGRNTEPTFNESLALEPERPVEPKVVSALGGRVSFEAQGPRCRSLESESGCR
jgi:hypothetical protein